MTVLACCACLLSACGSSSNPSPPPPDPPPPPPPPDPTVSGLDARPSNLTCLAPPLTAGGTEIELTRVFPSLSFNQPLAMLQAPNDDLRWFVLEKGGRVRVFDNVDTVTSTNTDFIDLAASFNLNTGSEGGLLGMAFHPDYETNDFVYLSFTEGSSPMVSVVARFQTLDNGMTLDPGTRTDILTLEQDFGNHNGGQIAFGPDGLLYIGFGDGGGAGDEFGRAQDTTNLLGAMLRIDVDSGTPYAIPPTNPFFGNATCPADPDSSLTDCPEIFAWGLRNPWRWSFDRANGDLWLGDVGQGAREEINIVELNGNYGWDCREGRIAYGSPAPSCSTATGLIEPVHDYPRTEGTSVTGGYVYRGGIMPDLVGNYLFADYGSGRVWRLVGDGGGGYLSEELLDTSLSIASFGEDIDGELYVVDIAGGVLYRIDPGPGAGPGVPVPQMLSDTGCVDPADPTMPASGLIPYSVAAPFWSDGADKERWIGIPNGTSIAVDGAGDFALPPRSVVMKHFRLAGSLVETRLLMHHPDGTWAGYTYEWDAGESDATLVIGGKVERINLQDWIFPSSAQCDICHTSAAGFSLGLEVAQLNTELVYPTTGRMANQLATLNAIGMFGAPVGDPGVLPVLADPADTAASLTERARAYLHTNCAQCHRPGGPTPSDLDLRASTLLDQTLACDVMPQAGDLGLGPGARIIAPGEAGLSVLVERMNRRDAQAMPPLASDLVDVDGVALMTAWIDSLTGCL